MRQKIRTVFINLSVLCILLVVGEGAGQLGYFIRYGYPIFASDRHPAAALVQHDLFELHPYLAGRLKSSVTAQNANVSITATDIHTRWTGANLEDKQALRIAVLGGSTTFCTGVTDADTWPAFLQRDMGNRFAVINYGIPGYSTAENIIQMSLLVPEQKPAIIVVYTGWNDIRNYHQSNLGSDYYPSGMKQFGNLGIPLTAPKTGMDNLAQASAIFRFGDYLALKWGLKKKKQPPIGDGQPLDTPDAYVDAIYLRNLKTIRTLARQLDSRLIFVPQVLNYADFRGKKGVGRYWSPLIEDDAMPALLDRFNLIINDVCEAGDAKCTVLTEAAAVSWEAEDFIDDGHFSKRGCEKFARLVADHIRGTDH